MSGKVTFLYNERIIQVNEGIEEIDVQQDIWSYAKEVWLTEPFANRFNFPLRVVGGDVTVGANRISPYFFLRHGWRLRPQEANHTLQIAGTFLVEGGGDPFLSTIGTYNVRIVSTVPIEAEFIVAQLPEIEFASFQNAVWYNANSPDAGLQYPRGTRQRPVNNINDALAILAIQGFGRLGLLSNATFDAGHNIEDIEVFGVSSQQTFVAILPEAFTQRARFTNVSITGELDGDTSIIDCEVRNLHYVNGEIKRSTIRSDATIQIDGNASAEIVDCNSGPPESLESFPIIDMGGSGQSLSVRNFNGKLKITNKTGPDKISLDINSGHIVLDETVTNGIVVSRGLGRFQNNSTGTTQVVSEDMVNAVSIADTVWEANLKERALDGSHTKAGFFLARTINDIANVVNVSGNEVTIEEDGYPLNLTPGLYDNRILQFHKNGEFVYEIRKVVEHKADGILVLDKEPVLVNNDDPWHVYILNQFATSKVDVDYELITNNIWSKLIDGMSAEDFIVSIKTAIDELDLNVDSSEIAEAVWNEQLSENGEDIAKTIVLGIKSELDDLEIDIDNNEIATAVWNSLVSEHEQEGSFGKQLGDLEVDVDNESIASAVWDKQISEHTQEGSTGNALATSSSGGVDPNILANAVWNHEKGQQVSTDTDRVRNIEEGNWKIEGTQMIFFDLEGNEMFRFDLKNQAGQPSNENVFERVRV